MSGKLRLNGATSGYSELQAPDVAGDQTFILPSVGGELVTKQGGGSVAGYQEGAWTPVPTQGSTTIAPDRNVWSRIGNTVTMSGYVADLTSTSSAVIAFTGAPYSGVSVTSGNASGSRIAGGVSSCYFRGGNDDTVQFLCTATSKSASWVQPKYQDTSTGNNGMYFSVTYITDDTTWVPINGATIS